MPQLKINVNGQKFVISGMSRNACSKQLLCALAKVNPQVEPRSERTGSGNSEGCSTSGIHTNGKGANQHTTIKSKNSAENSKDVFQTLLILGKENIKKSDDKRSEKVSTKRSSKKPKEASHFGKEKSFVSDCTFEEKVTKQERLMKSTDPARDNKLEKSSASKLKNGNCFKKLRETEKLKRAPFTGASYEYLTDLVKVQKKCLKTQHRRIREKEKTIKRYSKRIVTAEANDSEELIRNTSSDKNSDTTKYSKRNDKDTETDHDTGISEQHSSDLDGSCETQTANHRQAEVPVRHSLDHNEGLECLTTKQCTKNISCGSADREILSVACARKDEGLASRSACTRNDTCAEEKRSGVECVTYSNNTSVGTLESQRITANGSNHDDELKKEVGKIRVDIKSLQSQLEKQNRVIDLLTNLAEQIEISVEHENDKEVKDSAATEKHVRSLRSSINLSIELYDYQKSEMDANAIALRHAETEIRRKRWHVDSLRKHLDSLTMCTHSNKERKKKSSGKYNRLSGTLV